MMDQMPCHAVVWSGVLHHVHLKAMWSPVNIVTEEEERGRCEDRPHPPQHLLKANKVLEIAVKVTCVCACVCIVLLHRERERQSSRQEPLAGTSIHTADQVCKLVPPSPPDEPLLQAGLAHECTD